MSPSRPRTAAAGPVGFGEPSRWLRLPAVHRAGPGWSQTPGDPGAMDSAHDRCDPSARPRGVDHGWFAAVVAGLELSFGLCAGEGRPRTGFDQRASLPRLEEAWRGA